MRNRLFMLLFVLALSAAVALAQTSSTPSSTSSTPSQSSSDQMGSTSSTPSQSSTDMQNDKSMDKNSKNAAGDDESLHRQVHEQLASNPDLQNVQITVKNGTVTLEGTVAKKEDKHEAKKLAKAVPGVKNVKDHLTVNASASAATTPADNSAVSGSASATPGNPGSAAGEASQSGIAANAGASSTTPSTPGVAGEASAANQQSTTGATTSSTTSTEAQNPTSSSAAGTAGQNPSASSTMPGSASSSTSANSSVATPSSTNPDVSSTQQQSTGTAASNAQAPGTTSATQPSTAAGQQSQSGISTSTNPSNNAQAGVSAESQTQTMPAGDTDQLKSQIDNALKNEPTLSSSNVMVNVTADKIELSGDVATGKDKQTAKRIAQSYAGNRKVVDKITVKGMGKGANDSTNPSSTTPPPQL